MISQLQVISNQERKHTGLVMRTSYRKIGLKTQPPGMLPFGLAKKEIRNEDAQAYGTLTQKNPHFNFQS